MNIFLKFSIFKVFTWLNRGPCPHRWNCSRVFQTKEMINDVILIRDHAKNCLNKDLGRRTCSQKNMFPKYTKWHLCKLSFEAPVQKYWIPIALPVTETEMVILIIFAFAHHGSHILSHCHIVPPNFQYQNEKNSCCQPELLFVKRILSFWYWNWGATVKNHPLGGCAFSYRGK